MEPQTFEGTWEEVSRHASELAGRKVRLMVLDAPLPETTLDSALAGIIKESERLAATLPPAHPSSVGDAWGEGTAEKFRRQGFKL